MRNSTTAVVLLSSSVLFALFCSPQTGCEEFEVKSIVPAVKLVWDADFAHAYQLWAASSPQEPWEKTGKPLEGFDGEMHAYVDIPAGKVQFFRIEKLPNVPPGMVAIPGGTFQMGDHFGIGGEDERPVHTVRVDSFFMDAKEITNEQYCAFLNSMHEKDLLTTYSYSKTVCGPAPPGVSSRYASLRCDIIYDSDADAFAVRSGREEHPAVWVTWIGAIAYCNWRSWQEGLTAWYDLCTGYADFSVDGYRLPTEAEWEYAARGRYKKPYATYPWGDDIDGTKANFDKSGDLYEEEFPGTTPVGHYPPNSYGLYDMAGNADEWCYDQYRFDYYQYCIENSVVDNPTGPHLTPARKDSGGRVVRGGSWRSLPYGLRCSSRDWYGDSPGFRCVRRPKLR